MKKLNKKQLNFVISTIEDACPDRKEEEITMFSSCEDLNLDYLTYIEVLMKIEYQFNIHIDDDDVSETCNTVSDLVKLIEKNL